MDLRAWMLGCVVGSLALACGTDGGTGDGGSSSSRGADSSSGDAPQASVLEQCDAPTPCENVTRDPGSNNEAVSDVLECAITQALAAIADGTPAELTSSYCDIGCFGSDLLLIGDGTAYLQAWSTTDTTTFEAIHRCTLKDAPFFEACQGQPWNVNGCTSQSDWVTDCEVVVDAQCPG